MAENQKPNVERIYYDGEQFIFMETPEGPVMFAEIRGEGSDLAMDANAQRICDLWNQTVNLKGGPHSDPKDCPTWYDWCHCTVDALEHNIQRAQAAEAALKDRDDLLREYIEAEISGRLPFETYSKLTTKAMKLLGLRGDQASERFARETHPYNDQAGNGYCFDCGLPYQHPEANHTAPAEATHEENTYSSVRAEFTAYKQREHSHGRGGKDLADWLTRELVEARNRAGQREVE